MEDSQALLEEVISQVKAEEPGTTKVGDIVETSQDVADEGIPIVVQSIESAGYAYLWNTRTGDRSRFNKNMLAGPQSVLVRKWPDDPLKGRAIWSNAPVKNPPLPIKAGTLKCMLHKDSPERDTYNDMGFAICPKDNLASPYQVRRHMMKKHKDEWAAVEQIKADVEKEEDRMLRRAQTEALTGKPLAQTRVVAEERATEEATLYVSDKPPKAKKKRKSKKPK